MYCWDPDASIVVADLDGTITISDIEGHIRTLRLGQYDFIHDGACRFYSQLHAIGLRILYLTARPIDWADASRTHLDQAMQSKSRLPPGPLITNSSGLTGALFTEVHVIRT
jgi:phosphatidate phosphatase PAH1